MQTRLTLKEKIITSMLLIIGILFTYQAINVFIGSYIIYYDAPTSYRIRVTTLFSTLLNGNLLILSSLLFFKSKSFAALVYQCTGIMFVLYALNLHLLDLVLYNSFNWCEILISSGILLLFGVFLCIYFRRRNLLYKNKLILPVFTILGIITYAYINLFLFDWYTYLKM